MSLCLIEAKVGMKKHSPAHWRQTSVSKIIVIFEGPDDLSLGNISKPACYIVSLTIKDSGFPVHKMKSN